MNTKSPLLSLTRLALASALLLILAPTLTADEPEIEREVRIKIMVDDEVIDAQLDDLEIGDSQQFFTDGGTQVVATRTEEGYEFDIEGRDEPIVVRSADHGYAMSFDTDCDGEDCPENVFITKDVQVDIDGAGGEHRMVFVTNGDDVRVIEDGDATMTWIASDGEGHADGDVRVMRAHGGGDAVERLLSSGALDDLDESKRQEILDALLTAGDGEARVKVIKIRRDGEQE